MRIFVSHSAKDAEIVSALRQALSQSPHEVTAATEKDGPSEIAARLRSSDLVVACLLQPSMDTFVELGMALGSGRPTILLGSVGEPSAADAFDLPSVAPTGSTVLDAQGLAVAIERISNQKSLVSPAAPSQPITLNALAENPSRLDSVSYASFEALVRDWFGKTVATNESVSSGGRDGGYDFKLSHEGAEYLVQVKKVSHQGRVPVEVVRSLADAVRLSGSAGGVLVTSSTLTAAAQSIAQQSQLRVLSLYDLAAASSSHELLKDVLSGERDRRQARYQWLKEMKERNDKEPGKEFFIGLTGHKNAIAFAHHWRDLGYVAMRRGEGHPDDPNDILVRITGQGTEYVKAAERDRATRRVGF